MTSASRCLPIVLVVRGGIPMTLDEASFIVNPNDERKLIRSYSTPGSSYSPEWALARIFY